MTVTKGIFVGLSTIDIVYDVDEFPAPDAKITAKESCRFSGTRAWMSADRKTSSFQDNAL